MIAAIYTVRIIKTSYLPIRQCALKIQLKHSEKDLKFITYLNTWSRPRTPQPELQHLLLTRFIVKLAQGQKIV